MPKRPKGAAQQEEQQPQAQQQPSVSLGDLDLDDDELSGDEDEGSGSGEGSGEGEEGSGSLADFPSDDDGLPDTSGLHEDNDAALQEALNDYMKATQVCARVCVCA